MMYKIKNRNAPQYLTGILDELQGERTHDYCFRNKCNLKIPFCRLSSFKISFFPRTICSWNSLSTEVKTSGTLETFKNFFRKEDHELNVLYFYGERWPGVHHARMRIGCSLLRKDLYYNLHVVDDPYCTCGALLEDAKHFFLHCPRYNDLRVSLRDEIQRYMPITVKNLLFGNKVYSLEVNKKVFSAVHSYIMASKRFQ